jgi:ABC-type transporter MlaC component
MRLREILAGLDKKGSKPAAAVLTAWLGEIFDYETHARESFGQYWPQLAEIQRREALRVMTILLERSSIKKIRQFLPDRMHYLSEAVDAGNPAVATVKTRVIHDRKDREISYRMRHSDGRWKIVDVVIEGASTIEHNRNAFYKKIRSSGLPSFLESLRKRAERGDR